MDCSSLDVKDMFYTKLYQGLASAKHARYAEDALDANYAAFVNCCSLFLTRLVYSSSNWTLHRST